MTRSTGAGGARNRCPDGQKSIRGSIEHNETELGPGLFIVGLPIKFAELVALLRSSLLSRNPKVKYMVVMRSEGPDLGSWVGVPRGKFFPLFLIRFDRAEGARNYVSSHQEYFDA